MTVVKNINNNVSLCLDSDGNEVVVFGKGVGFLKPPAEVPLSQIERTFYDVNQQFLRLLSDISPEVVAFTARQMMLVQDQLPYETSSNLILTLADHLAFAMERSQKGIYIPMPSVYEMETNYPLEIDIGRRFVSALEQKFGVRLPKSEVQGVAMHFINARTSGAEEAEVNMEERYEVILEETTRIIEREMGLSIRRDTFNYARFATHVQYLLKRVYDEKHIDSANVQMDQATRDEYQDVSDCVEKIDAYLKQNWKVALTEEEKLYLIMHVNRVCSQEGE